MSAIGMVLQDDTARSDVGPILGVLGALGLTIAFVALQRSKRRHGDDIGYESKRSMWNGFVIAH
jgi:hypothetical protein